jgi:hypothetical protein
MENNLPGFQNNLGGGEVVDEIDNENPFNTINNSASSLALICQEPTPPFYKRPGDLALQGSNNAVIWLGMDRGHSMIDYSLSVSSGSSISATPVGFSGTIDIVTGRSRYLPTTPQSSTLDASQPERTNFFTTENTREKIERKKDQPGPALQGDLDFAVDAARLYVSMKTDGDRNFALTNEFHRMPAAIASGSIQPVSSSAYIIAKSDEVRIIARKQLENEYYPKAGNPAINGSIKIIKEGTKDGDLAAVVLQPDGTIQISGSRIFLGRHPDDGGKNESISGPEKVEDADPDITFLQPYVRYQQLEDLLNALLDDVKAFCDGMTAAPTPGYGNPSPAIDAAVKQLKTACDSRREEIVKLKSERIFGE